VKLAVLKALEVFDVTSTVSREIMVVSLHPVATEVTPTSRSPTGFQRFYLRQLTLYVDELWQFHFTLLLQKLLPPHEVHYES